MNITEIWKNGLNEAGHLYHLRYQFISKLCKYTKLGAINTKKYVKMPQKVLFFILQINTKKHNVTLYIF